MANVPEKVLAWLHNVLKDYADTQRAYNDIARTLATYRTLAPRTEVHTFENGSSSLLLTLSGTLPTTFRGTTYQFPIKLWLPKSYPREPPFTYVTPGSDMQIRAGQHVAVDGRVYHPYLRDWPGMLDRANVAELLGYVQQAFAKEPPVMSRSAPRPGPTQPPLPPKQDQSMQQSATNGTPPPRPPKSMSVQDPTDAYASATPRDVRRDGPPLPPLPGQRHGSAGQPPRPQHFQGYGPTPSPQPYAQQSQIYDQGRVYSPLPDQRIQHAPFPSQHPPHPSRTVTQYTTPSAAPPGQYNGTNGYTDARQTGHVQTQQHYAPRSQAKRPSQDLLSDPFDIAMSAITAPPPPVPVNPEKEHLLQALSSTLVQQAQQKVNQNVSALTPLQGQHNALRAAYARLEAELAQTQALDAAIASNETILRRSIQDCDHAIEAAKTRSLPQVDDVLVAQTLVAQQLWTASAEEAACREAMYVLQTAVDKGRINGSDFVRQMRGLGRECFLKMALARKCARGLGLETGR